MIHCSQWLVQTSPSQPMEEWCTVTPPSPELRAPQLPTSVPLATRWLEWWWGPVLSLDGALEIILSVLVRGVCKVLLNWCQVCVPGPIYIYTQLSVLTSLHWSMEGSVTIQPPPPDCREPWLHTSVLSLGINCPHPLSLGPVSQPECGVDHPSFVTVSLRYQYFEKLIVL